MSTPAPGSGDSAAPASPDLVARLTARLPAEGRVLLLDGGAGGPGLAMARPGVEHRPFGAGGALGAGALEPSGWEAVVLAAERPARGWHSLLAELRPALVEHGRVLLVLPVDEGAPSAGVADAVGALYETAYCVLHEDRVAIAPLLAGARGPSPAHPARAVLVVARVGEHAVLPYRAGDEDAILRLFGASFSPRRGIEHWRWKYCDNPFGTLAISCAFSPDGDLAAHYAAYPVPFRRARRGGGETLLCHQVGDTMTDRRHRAVGRGRTSLLARTARHFYARRCDGRVAFNYGFNTGNIQRFSQLFVGARKVWDLELRTCRPDHLHLAPPRRFRPYRVSSVGALDGAFDDLFERLAPDYCLLVERRRAYLDWRYLRCPDPGLRFLRVDAGSRLVGWGVFRRDGERLLWGDALIDRGHPGAASALLRHAIVAGDPLEPAAERIEGWFSRHPAWWSELLATLGFDVAPEPQDLGMVYVPFLEDPLDELRTRYYLTMGDGDLF
ncbi:MAG TPA: hypothetical protein VMS86_04000 [Thermoanaerobaculia bacterium]|nr:hypothetical protein [Thermoanaerobaculia bacterium]